MRTEHTEGMGGTVLQTVSLERYRSLERLHRGWRILVALAAAILLTLPGTAFRPSAFAPSVSPSSKVDPSLLKLAHRSPGRAVGVIVHETSPSSSQAEGLVRTLGGHVGRELSIISSFSAVLPAGRVPDLAASGSVQKIWSDGKITMSASASDINASTAANTVWQSVIHLSQAWSTGASGAGVTVALLDTGVSQNADLGSRVLARVDLTGEQDGLDHFGHGTHMAGIIAGDGTLSGGTWTGVAPRANLVSVKVAGADGSTDASVVISGLQWIVSHKDQYGIRVLNLSFGTDSTQSYRVDPLDYAVEQAWFAGITVVVAAGNRGPDTGTVNKPGDDPYVVTVGAADLNNTVPRSDDSVASFSSRGPTQDGLNKPGVLAPGVTIVSDRDPGSTIDQAYPSARVGDSYFKGTGTSQAAAVTSGVVALMLQANPSLTPNLVKGILMGTSNGNPRVIDANLAVYGAKNAAYFTPANLTAVPSTGTGSIEASRGSLHVYADLPQDGQGTVDADGQLDPVQGEIDVLGNTWNATGWLQTGWSATGWSATSWASVAWSATGWSSTGWAATGWSGTSWSATGWGATGWSSTAWNGTGWASAGWGSPMESTGWSSTGWSSTGWSSTGWSSTGWSGWNDYLSGTGRYRGSPDDDGTIGHPAREVTGWS
jgi:serine protease AprX